MVTQGQAIFNASHRIFEMASNGLADRADLNSFQTSVGRALASIRACDFTNFSQAHETATALSEQFAQAASEGPDALAMDRNVLLLGKTLREAFDKKCVCNRRT